MTSEPGASHMGPQSLWSRQGPPLQAALSLGVYNGDPEFEGHTRVKTLGDPEGLSGSLCVLSVRWAKSQTLLEAGGHSGVGPGLRVSLPQGCPFPSDPHPIARWPLVTLWLFPAIPWMSPRLPSGGWSGSCGRDLGDRLPVGTELCRPGGSGGLPSAVRLETEAQTVRPRPQGSKGSSCVVTTATIFMFLKHPRQWEKGVPGLLACLVPRGARAPLAPPCESSQTCPCWLHSGVTPWTEGILLAPHLPPQSLVVARTPGTHQ